MARLKKSPHKHRKRPIAATIIILLVLGEIALRLYWVLHYTLQSGIWLTGLPGVLWEAGKPTSAGLDLAAAVFRLQWLLVAIVVLIGLLRLRRWSWVMLVVWVSYSLSVGLLHYLYRADIPFTIADFAVMAADAVMVFALNQFDVQRIYGIRRDDAEPAG